MFVQIYTELDQDDKFKLTVRVIGDDELQIAQHHTIPLHSDSHKSLFQLRQPVTLSFKDYKAIPCNELIEQVKANMAAEEEKKKISPDNNIADGEFSEVNNLKQ